MNKILILLCMVLFSIPVFTQNFSITGTVSDRNGKPLQGVNIIVHNTTTGSASDVKGDYHISGLTAGNYTIEFSIIGYKKQRRDIVLRADRHLDIVLEEEAVVTEQVVVSGSKHIQKLSELPVSASLIENKNLLRYNYSNLRDALKYVPGLNLVEDQLSIRGSSGYSRGAGARVLLAIDGLPFYTGDTGEIIWEAIPVNEIERVEIIKGASSSLFGSTAIGGVINLVTKDVTQPFTYLKTYIGGYDKSSHDIWNWNSGYRLFNGQSISHSNVFGNFSFSASFTRLEDQGYKRNNFNKRLIGYLKAAYKFSDASSVKFLFNGLDQRSGNFIYWKDSRHALEPPDADLGQTVLSDRFMFGLISENKMSDNLDLIFRGSYYKTQWQDQTASRNSSDADLYRGEVQTNLRLSDFFLLISGFEINKSFVNGTLFGKPESFGAGFYSQGEYKFSFPLSVTAGIRYDYDEVKTLSSDHAFSPRAGLNYSLSPELSLRAMIGTGFRAPSLAEKFTKTFVSGISIIPNKNLDPESNITAETGVLWHNEDFSLDAAVFRNEYYNLIEPAVSFTTGEITFKNVVRARIQGLELTFSPVLADFLDFSFSYTFMHPRDINTNRDLKYRPEHLFYSSVSALYNGFEAGLNFRYWSRVKEIDQDLITLGYVPDGDKRVPVYVLDLNMGYNFLNIGFPGRAYINVKNLLNYNYIELIGNLAPLRNISLSFELFL